MGLLLRYAVFYFPNLNIIKRQPFMAIFFHSKYSYFNCVLIFLRISFRDTIFPMYESVRKQQLVQSRSISHHSSEFL